MTMAAAFEVWHETELRRSLLKIALSFPEEYRALFYSAAWALISRLKQGRSIEYYLARVTVELCTPRYLRGIRLPSGFPQIRQEAKRG
jgi:hypothetical protein